MLHYILHKDSSEITYNTLLAFQDGFEIKNIYFNIIVILIMF